MKKETIERIRTFTKERYECLLDKYGSFDERNYDGFGKKGQTYYGLTDNNTWATYYGDKGMLVGQGRCSTVSGTTNITTHTTSELGSEGGQYCYQRGWQSGIEGGWKS